jgi:diaminopimelate decarboxylase
VAGFGAAVTAAARSLELELVLEPGRFFVGNAGVLLTRVIGRKRGEARSFAIVDAAMNDLIRPALYGAYHPIVPVLCRRRPGARRCAPTWSGRCASAATSSGSGRLLPWPEPGRAAGGARGRRVRDGDGVDLQLAAAGGGGAGARRSAFAVTRPRRTIEAMIAEERMPEWLRCRGGDPVPKSGTGRGWG